ILKLRYNASKAEAANNTFFIVELTDDKGIVICGTVLPAEIIPTKTAYHDDQQPRMLKCQVSRRNPISWSSIVAVSIYSGNRRDLLHVYSISLSPDGEEWKDFS